MFRSPSPPPRIPSPLPKESERLIESQHAPGQKSSSNSFTEQKVMAMDAAIAAGLGQAVEAEISIDRKNSEELNGILGNNEDFSGISILAAAACNNSIEGGTDNSKEGSALDVSFVQGRNFEGLVNNESCSVGKESCKDYTDFSNEATSPSISAMLVEETTASLGTSNSSRNDVACGTNTEGPFFLGNSVAVSQNLPSNRDEGTPRRFESLRDDRSQWDLNMVMSVWESSSDKLIVGQKKVIDVISEDGRHDEKLSNLETCGVQREPGDTKHDVAKPLQPLVGRVTLGDVHEDICSLADSRSLAIGADNSNREDHKSDACTGPNRTTCFQEKVLSSEIDSGPSSMMDLDEEETLLPSQERISFNAKLLVSAPVEHAVERPTLKNTCAVADENASSQGVSFGCTENSESSSSHQVVDVDACVNHSACAGTDQIADIPVSEENRDTASTVAFGKQTGDEFVADAERGEDVSSSPHLETYDVSLSYAAMSEEANISTEDGEDACRISGLHDDGNVTNKLRSSDLMICQPVRPGPSDRVMNNAVGNLYMVDVSPCSPNSEQLSSSGASGKGEPVVDVGTKVQASKVIVADTAQFDSPAHIEPEELTHKPLGQPAGMVDSPGGFSSHEACRSCSDPGKSYGQVALEEDHFDDVDYDSDVSQDDPRGMEKETGLQSGYDSQYEDGELRDSDSHVWEEDAGEEGETEHVDYGSDNKDTYGCEAASDYPDSMSLEVEEEAECLEDRSAEVEDIDCERDQVLKKNVQDINCQPCLGGSSKTNFLEAGCCEKGSIMVKSHTWVQFARKDDIEKFDMDVKVNGELSTGTNRVTGENELHARGDTVKESTESVNLRMKLSGWDQLPEGSKSSTDMDMEVGDCSTKRNHTVAHMDGHDSGGSVTRVIGSTTSRRQLLSRIEGPTSSEVLLRKDRVSIQGSRYLPELSYLLFYLLLSLCRSVIGHLIDFLLIILSIFRSSNVDNSNPRVERDTGSAKSIGRGGSSLLHMHGRGRGGDRWVESSGARRGPEHHHSPRFGHPGPKIAAAAAAAKIESSGLVVAPDGTLVKASGVGSSGRARRQSVNASSQGVHRSLTRRGSPTGRDESLGMHMGHRPVGDMSPDRSISVGRGRPGRYGPQVVGTGFRERYHGPVPDDSSLRMQHPLVTRERSYSPIQRRGATHLFRSHTKSPSRSGTRSPYGWASPRGRNGGEISNGPGSRHRSRSPPNFRSDSRTERVRSTHRRPGFSADHMVGFVSPSRSHGSPQHTPRWIDERKDAVDHFREHGYRQRPSFSERRSPGAGRVLPRSHRFDLVGSTGRLKQDEYYRPMHPGRFPEMVGAGRGPRYEESDDDRRKHGDRYGFVHPVRRYDTGGPVKRFRYDVEDGFVAHNSHNKDEAEFHGRGSPKNYDRGTNNRIGDAPRRPREEKGHFRYGRDWKYHTDSKSFGMRELDEDVAPRRRIPS